MSVTSVNLHRVELSAPLDEAGFRHIGTSVARQIGARRIGATVYEAEAGFPIWPYHYHHGIEEWLYVLAGAPVLREPAGERVLAPGDLVAFPSGPHGAHTLQGPGRFVIFSTGREPYMSVYPDSDKVSGPEGILLLSSAVGYWHGEGTAGPTEPDERAPRPASPPQPVVGTLGAEAGELGPALGAELLGATLVDLDHGEASEPYRYVHGREQWLLVLAGTPTLRHPQGEDRLETGDLVCLPEGPAGAHRLLNRGEPAARALLLSTTGLPAAVHYPEAGRWVLLDEAGEAVVLGEGDR